MKKIKNFFSSNFLGLKKLKCFTDPNSLFVQFGILKQLNFYLKKLKQ